MSPCTFAQRSVYECVHVCLFYVCVHVCEYVYCFIYKMCLHKLSLFCVCVCVCVCPVRLYNHFIKQVIITLMKTIHPDQLTCPFFKFSISSRSALIFLSLVL